MAAISDPRQIKLTNAGRLIRRIPKPCSVILLDDTHELVQKGFIGVNVIRNHGDEWLPVSVGFRDKCERQFLFEMWNLFDLSHYVKLHSSSEYASGQKSMRPRGIISSP